MNLVKLALRMVQGFLDGIVLKLPLSFFGLTLLVNHDIDWQVLVLMPILAIASIFIVFCGGNLPYMIHSQAQIAQLVKDFSHCKIQQIPLAEFLKELFPEGDFRQRLEASKNEPLSRFNRYQHIGNDNLRVFRLTTEHPRGRLPSSILAFPSVFRSTIFLQDAPNQLSGYQKMILLHELGHSTKEGHLILSELTGKHISLILSLPIISLLAIDGIVELVNVLALLVLAVLLGHVSKKMISRSLVIDEIGADLYALRRLDKRWLDKFRKQPPEKIASYFSYDRRLDADHNACRKEILAKNIDCLLQNKRIPTLGTYLETAKVFNPEKTKVWKVALLLSQLIIASLVIGGLLAPSPRGWQLAVALSLIFLETIGLFLLFAIFNTLEGRMLSSESLSSSTIILDPKAPLQERSKRVREELEQEWRQNST